MKHMRQKVLSHVRSYLDVLMHVVVDERDVEPLAGLLFQDPGALAPAAAAPAVRFADGRGQVAVRRAHPHLRRAARAQPPVCRLDCAMKSSHRNEPQTTMPFHRKAHSQMVGSLMAKQTCTFDLRFFLHRMIGVFLLSMTTPRWTNAFQS